MEFHNDAAMTMTSPRNRSPGCWITAGLVALLVGYPLSFGPAVWLVSRGYLDKRIAERAFWPALCAYPHCQWLIRGYGELGLPKGKHLTLEMTAPDGIGYSTPFDGR